MLLVNEIFGPTIQGEGKTRGKEVVFLRLALCNLHCVWCDTPYTWNWHNTPFSHPEKFSKEKEIHKMTVEEVLDKLEAIGQCKALVVSGGEPLIQQKELAPLLGELRVRGWWIEVETNGTIFPEWIGGPVHQFNCSPKLSNSGNELRQREREALSGYAAFSRWPSPPEAMSCNFKFVISGPRDIDEVVRLVQTYDMRQVYLMAEGKTRQEQVDNSRWVSELACLYGFEFSPRLHVLEHDTKRGV